MIWVSPSRCFVLAAFAAVLLAVSGAGIARADDQAAAAQTETTAPADPTLDVPPPATPQPVALAPGGCRVGPAKNFLAADATVKGVISLIFFGARGAPVDYFECVDGNLVPLGHLDSGSVKGAVLKDATTWDCARPVRHFAARATLPDGTQVAGTYSVRTGSCASRFNLLLPARIAPDSVARVRIVDRWGIGDIKALLCISPPRGDRVCQQVGFARAVTIKTRRFRASTLGRWRVDVRVLRYAVTRYADVGGNGPAPAPPLRLLATGDSTIQGVDNFLADELVDKATVISDIRVGTGISKSDWQAIADGQVKRDHPNVTVMSVGVNEGFPLPVDGGGKVECCDAAWKAAYVQRVRRMMSTYLGRGRGRVIWCTLPLPRGGPRTDIITAVNDAVVRAGEGMKRVTIARMDLLFSPNGFTEVIRYRGRDVRVRALDGIHLSVSGTAIAAKFLAAIVRKR